MGTLEWTFQPQIPIHSSQLSMNIKESLLYLLSSLLESEIFSLMWSKGFLSKLLYFCASRYSWLSPLTFCWILKYLRHITYHFFPQLFSVNATNLINNLQFRAIPCIQRLIFRKIYVWHLFCLIGIQRSASRVFQSLTAPPEKHKILQVRAPHMLLVWH